MNELITVSLAEGSVSRLLGIPKPLLGSLEVKWVEWISDYATRYGKPPTLERFESEFPVFMRVESVDPLEDVADRTVIRKRNIHFVETITREQAKIRAGMDPAAMIRSLDELYRQSTGKTITTKLPDHSGYFSTRTIFPWNIPLLDRATGGIAAGDYVLVFGRPGSFKTTFVDNVVHGLRIRDKRVLYISNENGSEEVRVKLDAFLAGFNPIAYRTGEWSDRVKTRLQAAAYISATMTGEIIIPIDPLLTVSQVTAAVEEHKPDLVFIDGVYLMQQDGSGGWQELANISRDLKRLARAQKLPIIGTIQANRSGEGEVLNRNNVAHSDAFLQDADSLIAMNRVGDRVVGSILKSRWGATLSGESFTVDVNFDHMTVNFPDGVISEEVAETEW